MDKNIPGTKKALQHKPCCCKLNMSESIVFSYQLGLHCILQTWTILLIQHMIKILQKTRFFALTAASTKASWVAAVVVEAPLLALPENMILPCRFVASEEKAVLLGLFFLAFAILISSSQLPPIFWYVVWFPQGLSWLSFSKASLNLQVKVWAVKMTSVGLRVLPSWVTMFLWFHIVQRNVKMEQR